MMRDLDLCREILRRLDAHAELLHAGKPKIDGKPQEEVAYNLDLLCEAGLVWSEYRYAESLCADAEFAEKISQHMYRSPDRYRLTWAGHEFLDASRNDTLWNSAKRTVKETTGGLTFEFLRAVLMQKGKELLGLE